MDREKEIKLEIYKKSVEIKNLKKDIIRLHEEYDMLYGYKRLEQSKVRKIGGRNNEKTK